MPSNLASVFALSEALLTIAASAALYSASISSRAACTVDEVNTEPVTFTYSALIAPEVAETTPRFSLTAVIGFPSSPIASTVGRAAVVPLILPLTSSTLLM